MTVAPNAYEVSGHYIWPKPLAAAVLNGHSHKNEFKKAKRTTAADEIAKFNKKNNYPGVGSYEYKIPEMTGGKI